MKAIDYFNEYGDAVLRESIAGDEKDAISSLFRAFVREMKEIIYTKGVQTNRAVAAVVKEQNQKWNALCRLYEKKYGEDLTPIKYNGFMNAIKDAIPEICRYLPKEG
jgi:hypothetical protein